MPFIIDRTIGRDVKLSFDFTGDDIDSFRKIRFFKPDCQNSECIKNIDLSDIKTLHLQHIEPTLEVITRQVTSMVEHNLNLLKSM